MGLFLAASLMCSAAPSLGWLLAARGLQGVGAALLMPTSLAILGSRFEGEARGKAIGTWAVAGAIGPLVGGWLIDLVGWRAMFLLNVPVGVGAPRLGASHSRAFIVGGTMRSEPISRSIAPDAVCCWCRPTGRPRACQRCSPA